VLAVPVQAARWKTALRGLDYFILDATLAHHVETWQGKAKYLRMRSSAEPRWIAGTTAAARPLHAWAAAPSPLRTCQFLTIEVPGAAGMAPMNPLRWDPAPLSAWLQDVGTHGGISCSAARHPRQRRQPGTRTLRASGPRPGRPARGTALHQKQPDITLAVLGTVDHVAP
jgi:hypothetical protein